MYTQTHDYKRGEDTTETEQFYELPNKQPSIMLGIGFLSIALFACRHRNSTDKAYGSL